MEFKKEIDSNLGITVVLMFSSILVIISMIVMGNELGWDFGFNNVKSNNTVVADKPDLDGSKDYCSTSVCDNLLVNFLGNNTVLDDDFNIRTFSDKISISRFSKYADVNTSEGNLVFNVHKYSIDEKTNSIVIDTDYDETFTYAVPDENIKYIYTLYSQPSGEVSIYLLTDANNLYMSRYSHLVDPDFDTITDFKLVNSNVSDMKVLEVSEQYEGVDRIVKKLYAVIDGENVLVY